MSTYQHQQLDALGDSTRRAIIERLLHGPLAVGRLAEGLPVSRPAVSQHLRVLERAKLATCTNHGNKRLYRLDSHGFEVLRHYFDRFWTDALAEFKKKAEETQPKESYEHNRKDRTGSKKRNRKGDH